MVSIYNPNNFAGHSDSSLLNINFFNVLYFNPFKIYTIKFLKLQIRQLLLYFYLDRL